MTASPTGGPPHDSASDDLLPVSVRLGEVVAPDDPEDWTRPLTWVAALGMLGAPLAAFAWFGLAPPTMGETPLLGTWVVAVFLAAGAALAGATQRGAGRAAAGTIVAALFGALVTIVAGVTMAGERQLGTASPTLVHALAAGLAGLAGAAASAAPAALLASRAERSVRALAGAATAGAVSLLVVPLLFRG